MAARVTPTEVKAILDTQLEDATVEIFIMPATLLVDRIESEDTANTLDAATLKEIERWLAAHFTSIRDQRVASETAGPVSQSYQYKVGLNFNLTMYGGTALALDTTGFLASLQKQAETGTASKIVASMRAMGPVSNEDIDDGVFDQ